MDIKILFDSNAVNESFSTGWGFSCLVDNTILFDTGENANFLLNNLVQMKTEIDSIEAVVISHEHWDHIGGLWGVLKQKAGMKVFVCPGFTDKFKSEIDSFGGEIVECSDFCEIRPDVFLTGQMDCLYKGMPMPEQAMIIKSKKGINIITGCSHPGIGFIVEKVRKAFASERLSLVMGGFHLKDNAKQEILAIVKKFKELGVDNVLPTHCSGDFAEKIFENSYKKGNDKIMVGQVLQI